MTLHAKAVAPVGPPLHIHEMLLTCILKKNFLAALLNRICDLLSLCVSVYLLVTTVSCAKWLNKSICRFWVWIWVGQKNCVLGGVPDLSMKIGNLWGGIPSHCKVRETCCLPCRNNWTDWDAIYSDGPTEPCSVLFCSLAVLDPRVGHIMDVLSPFMSEEVKLWNCCCTYWLNWAVSVGCNAGHYHGWSSC